MRTAGRQVVSHTARPAIQIPASAAPVRLHLCVWCAHASQRLLIHNTVHHLWRRSSKRVTAQECVPCQRGSIRQVGLKKFKVATRSQLACDHVNKQPELLPLIVHGQRPNLEVNGRRRHFSQLRHAGAKLPGARYASAPQLLDKLPSPLAHVSGCGTCNACTAFHSTTSTSQPKSWRRGGKEGPWCKGAVGSS